MPNMRTPAKRLAPIAILAAVLVSLFSCASNAQLPLAPPSIPGDVVYIAFPVEIAVDGQLDDWVDVPLNVVVNEEAADPAENGSFQFQVAADENNLYLTMQMPDANIIAGQHGADYWNEDSMEFYVNASDNLNAGSYDLGIFQVNVNATNIGNEDPDALSLSGVNNFLSNASGYVFATADGWGLEVAIPLDGLVTPAHGVEIGFQAQINGASQLDRDVILVWSNYDPANQSWQNPFRFGTGIFFEVGQSEIPQRQREMLDLVLNPPDSAAEPEPFMLEIPEEISVNQLGYLPGGVKRASLIAVGSEPLDWQLLDNTGTVVLEGQTTYFGSDAESGDELHSIDFSAYETTGAGFTLQAGGLESPPFEIAPDLYSQLKLDALTYFYHNRSGIPIEAEYVGEAWARPAGHTTDSEVTCNQGDDAAGNTWEGCDYTLDGSKGWYDAGDFGKYVVNGGISAWTLINLYEQFPDAFPDGALNIPESGNDVPDILDEARWEMAFLLGMQVPEGERLAGMAHHKLHDRSWAPLPMVPPTEVDNDSTHQFDDSGRYVYAPSTAATLNLAATAAQCARVYAEIDPDFAARCLTAAESAWQAALAFPNHYFGNTPGEGGGNYDDQNVTDEFYWAAAELYVTTGGDEYLDFLHNSEQFGANRSFQWQDTGTLGTLALLTTENGLSAEERDELLSQLLAAADELLNRQADSGYGVMLSGDFAWGSNGDMLNNLMLVSVAYQLSGEQAYLDAVLQGMDYILGHNALNQSFVTGYGAHPVEHPHHRFWANDPDNGYPPAPAGAVAGGPNASPNDPDALDASITDYPPAKRYMDVIGSFSTNEITINWNAPLAWVSAFLDAVSE